jgi:hypothetical protein
MGKERVTFEGLNDCDHTVMAPNPQIIALGHVVGQDYPRGLANSRKYRQKYAAL